MSETTSFPDGPDIPHLDKALHLLLYLVLGAALAWGRRAVGPSAPHWALVAVGWAYAAVDEVHQSVVPGRTPDPWDFLVDVLGVTVGYTLFLIAAGNFTRAEKTG